MLHLDYEFYKTYPEQQTVSTNYIYIYIIQYNIHGNYKIQVKKHRKEIISYNHRT